MGSAGWQGVSHKARLAVKGEPLCKRRNTVDEALPIRPQGAYQMRPCCVAVLNNGTAIVCVRRLAPRVKHGAGSAKAWGHFLRGAWTHVAGSEPINAALLEYHIKKDGYAE